MPKKCKNPLMMVTATIAYYTLGDLSRISKILGADVITIVGGLIPKERSE